MKGKENTAYSDNGILSSHNKEGKTDICNNMNKYGGHPAKWNNSDTERQISVISLIWGNLKMLNSEKQRVQGWVPRTEG